MHGREKPETDPALTAFVHNRYFYGQLLDVHHFELEQRYFKEKIWLAHRIVSGYGVVCGLDVKLCDHGRGVTVLPGIALDKAGHEILVPAPSACVPLPDAPPQYEHQHQQEGCECEHGRYVQVSLCFHECPGDPAPVLASECETERCTPSSVRERYKIVLKQGRAPAPTQTCSLPDVVSGGRINYDALATWVTRPCRPLPDDVCIPLANVQLTETGKGCEGSDIDITIRPIVYTNDLLYELLLCLSSEGQTRPRGGKY